HPGNVLERLQRGQRVADVQPGAQRRQSAQLTLVWRQRPHEPARPGRGSRHGGVTRQGGESPSPPLLSTAGFFILGHALAAPCRKGTPMLRKAPFTLPAAFLAAFGYPGGRRFVALFWEPSGDEACYDDGVS